MRTFFARNICHTQTEMIKLRINAAAVGDVNDDDDFASLCLKKRREENQPSERYPDCRFIWFPTSNIIERFSFRRDTPSMTIDKIYYLIISKCNYS